jgi:hypothetical protein
MSFRLRREIEAERRDAGLQKDQFGVPLAEDSQQRERTRGDGSTTPGSGKKAGREGGPVRDPNYRLEVPPAQDPEEYQNEV